MNVLAFAASNSKHSINRTLAVYAAGKIQAASVEVLDIHDYEMPIFSEDREKELGQPEPAQQFLDRISEADALIIAYAEHNGSFTAAYKNLVDWASRIERKVFQDKPTLMLATSPGGGGGANVLALAENSAPYFGADVKARLSVPSFHKNFDVIGNELSNPKIRQELNKVILALEESVPGLSGLEGYYT